MQNKILLVMGIIIVAGGVIYFAVSGNSDSSKVVSDTQNNTMVKDETKASGENMANETAMQSGAMVKAGSYKNYSSETVVSEQTAGNKVVLFFHAPWCPFCKAADTAFTANLDQIPAGVTVLKTDYDSQTALKQKYGVTYQHTFVQIDSSSNQVSKWNGGDIDNLKKYVK